MPGKIETTGPLHLPKALVPRHNPQTRSGKDRAKAPAASRRTDGDYALSYIQRVGNGRVFYEADGHDEKVYFSWPFVAHMLEGIQYVLGDLEADDSPSEK